MDQITQVINDFLSIPGIQATISIIAFCIGVGKIIASTSIGKKILNDLKSKYFNLEKDYQNIVNEHKEYVATKEQEFNRLSQEYEAKLYKVIEYSQKHFECLKSALLQINNDKVQSIIKEIDLVFPTDVNICEEIEKAKAEVKDELEQKIKNVVFEVLENGKETENN